MQESFYKVPINQHLGFRLISRSPESASITMEPSSEFIQEEGIIHGAILTALADTAAVYTFHPDLSPDMTMTSIEFKVNFFSPALIDGGAITARSSVIRKGRKIGVCDVDVMQGNRHIAKGLFTYLFYVREPKP
ncbi:PaaI family thioesterase [bacterium]|nr:PaaI family thioesterase [bacterium]